MKNNLTITKSIHHEIPPLPLDCIGPALSSTQKSPIPNSLFFLLTGGLSGLLTTLLIYPINFSSILIKSMLAKKSIYALSKNPVKFPTHFSPAISILYGVEFLVFNYANEHYNKNISILAAGIAGATFLTSKQSISTKRGAPYTSQFNFQNFSSIAFTRFLPALFKETLFMTTIFSIGPKLGASLKIKLETDNIQQPIWLWNLMGRGIIATSVGILSQPLSILSKNIRKESANNYSDFFKATAKHIKTPRQLLIGSLPKTGYASLSVCLSGMAFDATEKILQRRIS